MQPPADEQAKGARLIVSALAGFLLLCLAYSVLVSVAPAETLFALNDRQANRLRAERWLYRPPAAATVVVGSSLAARLEGALPADEYHVLAFGGGSSLTGLELLARGPRLPERVLVEGNVLTRGTDHELIKVLFTPGLASLRRALPLLRQENQPLVYALAKLVDAGALSAGGQAASALMTSEFFEGLVDIQRRAMAHVDSAQAQRVAAEMARRISEIQRRGVEVVILEMPIHPELVDSPASRLARSKMGELAKACGCVVIGPAVGAEYPTTDGLHLTADAAERFGRLVASVPFARSAAESGRDTG